MDDGSSPTLEVGFAIDTGGAFGELLRFSQMFDDRTVQIVRQVAEIEKAAGGLMQLGPATARVTTFANASTRAEQTIRREKQQTEQSIERMIKTLDRERLAVGRTREEQRAARIEELALAAARQGNTDAAERLAASARALGAAQSALAEDKLAAEMKATADAARERERAEAAVNAQLIERSRLEAALDRITGADRPTAVQGGATFSALAERERALELAKNEAAATRQQNALLAERASIEAALERTTGLGRPSALQSGASIGALSEMVRKEEELAAATDRIRASLDPTSAAQRRFTEEISLAQRAVSAGMLSLDEYVAKLRMERAALKDVEQAHNAVGGASKRAQQDLAMVAVQIPDIVGGLLTGQRPMTVFIQQGAQIAQTAQMAEGGVAGLARTIAGVFTPAVFAAGATVAVIVAAIAAWWDYGNAVQKAADLSRGSGIVIGTNADMLERNAEAAAHAGNLTIAAARDIQNGYVQLGGIGANVLTGLTATTAGFARATGQDAASAAKELGAAFQDPVKGAEDLTLRYGVLTQAQIDHIQELVQQNDLYGAQQALLSGLAPQFDKAAVHATGLAGAWEYIATAASNAWTAMGKAMDRALGGGTLTQKIEDQYQQRYRYLQQTGGYGDTSVYDKRIADMQAQLSAERAAETKRTADARAKANAQQAAPIVSRVIGTDAKDKLQKDLGIVNSVLADTGNRAGLTADQLKQLRQSQEMLTNAVSSYLTPAEKSVKLAKIDAQLAAAKSPAAKAALAAQRAQVEASGKLVTTEEAQATAAANAARARAQASKSGQSHAETLARDAASTEAQIRNLYALRDAYSLSSGETLIAEARTKAESDAIKKRGDTEEFVARQVRLVIAQRVADASKGAAAMREQATAQEQVNSMVAAGLVPAERASDLIRDRMADLPLLAAIEAAQKVKDVHGLKEATAALEEQRAARERLANAQRLGEAERSAATMRDQAAAQEQVNAMVAAGLIPAERAGELVRERMADLPLLAAIAAAAAAHDLKALRDATAAYEDLRASRERLTKAEADGRYNAATDAGKNRLAELREELRLIGATDEARARGIAELRARQEAANWKGASPDQVEAYVKQQSDIAAQTVFNTQAQDACNASLTLTADKWDIIAGKVQSAAQGMSEAFGEAGRAIGDVAAIYASYEAQRTRAVSEHDAMIKKAGKNEKLVAQENARFALRTSGDQIGMYADMAGAAKGFFAEGSKGWKALQAAEQVYRAVQLAMSIRAMVQNTIETVTRTTNAATAATAEGTAGIASQSKLPFPANIAAMAATAAALVAAGVAIFGGGSSSSSLPKANDGTGTVLGDSSAKSESVKNAIDALKDVDTLTNVYSRQMLESLRSIDSQISGVASVIVRGGDINASTNVAQGFKPNVIGSVLGSIPLIGGILSGLFGTRTDVTGSGIYGGAQSLGSVLNGGFNGQAYSDVTKTKKFLGIVSGRSYSTEYGALDPALSNQFTLILRGFNDSIKAAAGPLGESTEAIQQRLNGFVVNIGKIDLKGLTGEQIQEKLSAVFGAAADNMAKAAFPGIEQFQKVGEGAFETLVRVSSTVEAVSTALDQLGGSTKTLGVAAKLGLADQFDSISDLTGAVSDYFQAFYTKEEQAAAQTAQFSKVFASLGLSMPTTLAGFRALVEAQDLTTAAGQSTYATLLKLAPAFADLQNALAGAKSAADIISERADLQRQLLQLQGDTQALRDLDLAKIDPSNRALQQQVWALADAQEAAQNAQALADAWKSVGESIMDEVKRIRGLSDSSGGGTFASLLGQFNAATVAARGGDQDAAKSLTGLSQSLLTAAGNAATSRQELDRIRAQTAASLEATYGVITALTKPAAGPGSSSAPANAADAAATAQTASAPAANDDAAAEIRELRSELARMREENNIGMATIAGNTGKAARILDNVSGSTGGDRIAVTYKSE